MSLCSEFEYIFITGDFNAQTANMRDCSCADILLDKHLDLDQETLDYFDHEAYLLNNNIQVNRVSKDRKTNNSGYKLVDICKNNNMYMLNGRYGQDARKGDFTFRDQSAIDYSITSNKGFTILTDFKIHELVRIYSDGHSLLHMTLNLNAANTPKAVGFENNIQQNNQKHECKHKCEQHKSSTFNENINASNLQDLNTYLESDGYSPVVATMLCLTHFICAHM